MIENRTKFIPIRGPIDKINIADKTPGAFYIATDTGEMFLDISTQERLPIGNSGVKIYNREGVADPEIINKDQNLYKMGLTGIQDFRLNAAAKGDLILDISTSTFYSIDKIVIPTGQDENNNPLQPYIECFRLAFSGAGGDGADTSKRIIINNLDELYAKMQKKGNLYIYGESFEIEVQPFAQYETSVTVFCRLISNNTTYYTFSEVVEMNVLDPSFVSFDIGKQMHTGKNTIQIEIVGNNSISASTSFNATVINFQLKDSAEFMPEVPVQQLSNLQFKAIPYGAIAKTFHYAIDPSEANNEYGFDLENAAETAKVYGTQSLGDKDNGNVFSFNPIYISEDLTHGGHTLKAWMTARTGDHDLISNILSYQIGVYEPNNENAVVWITNAPKEVEIYDKLRVQFAVYDPKHVGSPNYTFQKIDCMDENNQILITFGGSEELYVENKKFLWNINKITLGENVFKIAYGGAEKAWFTVNVTKSTRENMKLSNTATLKINLDAAGRSNSEIAINRNKWYIDEDKSDTVKFKNFNWTTDGWQEEDGCLLIANGAEIEIPIPGMVNGSLPVNNSRGKYTFEIRGKIKNIKDYSTLIANETKYHIRSHQDPTVLLTRRTGADEYDNYLSIEEANNWYSINHNYTYSDLDIVHDAFGGEEVQVFKRVADASYCCAKFLDNNKVGIGLGTQETYFSSKKYRVNAKYKENELFSLTYVIDFNASRAFIYLNGLLTGVTKLESENFTMGTNTGFVISSGALCDFELYSFRFYADALNTGHIVQNYLYDIRDADAYDQNAIAKISDDGNLDIDFTEFIKYNETMAQAKRPTMLVMPYMILETVDNLGKDAPYKINTDSLPDYMANIVVSAGHSVEAENYTGKPLNDQRLPYKKEEGQQRLVKVTFVNPSLDYAMDEGEIDALINSANATATEEEKISKVIDYYTSRCPSFEAYGGELAVQGTSSQAYPRRNYKLKLKDSDFWVYRNEKIRNKIMEYQRMQVEKDLAKARQDLAATTDEAQQAKLNKSIAAYENSLAEFNNKTYACPFSKKPTDTATNKYSWRMEHENPVIGTTKFTLKIDYMESSGSYNTGFANMINTMYQRHPLDYYAEAIGKEKGIDYSTNAYHNNEYRTSVQGFPIAMFHKIKRSDGADQYNFIGRYNMNLDKGSDECYGFKSSDTNIFKGDKKFSKICECWEMSNNQGSYCSFKPLKVNGEYDWSGAKAANLSNTAEADPAKFENHIAKHIEYRYNDNEDYLDALNEFIIDKKPHILGDFIAAEVKKPSDAKPSDYAAYKALTTEQREALKDTAIFNEETNIKVAVYKAWFAYDTEQTKLAQKPTVKEISDITEKYYGNLIKLLKWMDAVNLDANIPEDETFNNWTGEIVELSETEKMPFSITIPKEVTDKYIKELFTGAEADKTEENYYHYINVLTGLPLAINDTFEVLLTFDTSLTIHLEDLPEEAQNIFGSSGAITIEELATGGYQIHKDDIVLDPISVDLINGQLVAKIDLRQPNAKDANGNDLTTITDVITITKQFTYDTKEYRKAKFKAEFNKHWNLDYCLIYFVMTELLLCYDSRGKNLMVASWGPMENGGDYIWFPIFYDIDTQLGINNTGIPTWDYNVDASVNAKSDAEIAFSTSQSILWKNLLACYPNEIAAKYRELRKDAKGRTGTVNESFIENMYRCENGSNFNYYSYMGVRPLSILNADAEFKYIKITNSGSEITDKINNVTTNILGSSKLGYYDVTGALSEDQSGSFFYAVQGDRDLSRRLLLRNRINYLDSYWSAGNYNIAGATGDSSIWMRLNANAGGTTSDALWFSQSKAEDIVQNLKAAATTSDWVDVLKSTAVVGNLDFNENSSDFGNKNLIITSRQNYLDALEFEATPYFKIKPFLHQYLSVGYDDIYTTPIKAESGKNTIVKSTDNVSLNFLASPNLGQQLVYVPGAEYISSLGDLSLKYLDEIHLLGASRITNLYLGNSNPKYKNALLGSKTGSLVLADEITSKTPKTLLEEIELSGLIGLADNTIDVTGSQKLKSFKALRTKIQSVGLSPNIPIHTLYMPSSTTTLTINNFVNLNHFIAPLADPLNNYPTEGGLYLENFGSLASLEILKDHFGYDSYNLVANYLTGHLNEDSNLEKVNITGIDWTPFKLLENIVEIENGKTYYRKQLNSTFIPVSGTELREEINENENGANIIKKLILDKRLYSLKEDITLANAPFDRSNLQIIKNIVSANDQYELANGICSYTLAGDMYINDANAIDQTVLTTATSELNVYAAKVNPCRIIQFRYSNENNETIIYNTYKAEFEYSNGSQEGIPVIAPKLTDFVTKPLKENRDFVGWKIIKYNNDDSGAGEVIGTSLFGVDIQYLKPADYEDLNYNTDGIITTFVDPYDASQKSETNSIVYIFEAQFAVHNYHIIFTDVDENPNSNTAINIDVAAGELIPKPDFMPVKDASGLSLAESYKFIGWTRTSGSSTLENFKTARATIDRIYYPCFIQVTNGTADALINIDDLQNFAINDTQLIFKNTGYSGKITLPYYTPDGKRIQELIGLRDTKVTHVFWYNNMPENITDKYSLGLYRNEQLAVYNNTTWKNEVLQYFEIPEDITSIGAYSFFSCQALLNIVIPGSVTALGNQAFGNIGDNDNRMTLQIGSISNPIKVELFTNTDSNALFQTFIQTATIYHNADTSAFYSGEQALGVGVEGEYSAFNTYWCAVPPTHILV